MSEINETNTNPAVNDPSTVNPNDRSSVDRTSPQYARRNDDPAGPPERPDVDLTKRFYLKAGVDVIASFDTREEVESAQKDLEEHKSQALTEASKVTHLGKITIADRGMTHGEVRQDQERGGGPTQQNTAVNSSDVAVKRNDAVARTDGEKRHDVEKDKLYEGQKR
jgi:hypothetical protein